STMAPRTPRAHDASILEAPTLRTPSISICRAKRKQLLHRWPDCGRPARSLVLLNKVAPICSGQGKEAGETPAVQEKHLLRRPCGARRKVGYVVRIDPGRILPAALVVVRHAVVRERDHAVERAGTARVPHRLDADILVVAGIVHLIEFVAAAELGA